MTRTSRRDFRRSRLCKLVGALLALAMSAALCLNFVPEAQAGASTRTNISSA